MHRLDLHQSTSARIAQAAAIALSNRYSLSLAGGTWTRLDDVVIGGRLIGSVRAIRLILQSTSHVEGDLIHQSLAMEQGAFFEGKSRRSDNPLSTTETTAEKTAPSEPKPMVQAPKKQKEKPEAAFVRALPEPD